MKLLWFSPFLCSLAISQPLTLKESIDFALNHSPTLSSSKVQRQIAELDVLDRRSAFLPSLDLDSSIGLSKGKTAYETEPWTSSLNLKLTEKLYDNGKSYTLLGKYNLAKEVAELSYKKDRDTLCLQVVQALYEYSNQLKLSLANKQQYDLIQKQFSDAGKQYKGGLRTRRDFLRFKTEAQSAELNERTARNTVEKIKSTLRRLVGDDTNSLDFAVIEPESLPNAPGTQTLELKNTYEYRIAEMTSRLSGYDVSLAKRSYWPGLDFTANAVYANSNFINSPRTFREGDNYYASAGLTLSFNIWDWGIRKRDVERAESQVQIAEYSLKSKELELKETLKNISLDLETLKGNYDLSQELLKAQEDAYKLIHRDYQDGTALYTDLIDSLSKLLSAKTAYFQSRYQLAGAIAKTQYYEGKIYETLLK